MPRMLLSSVWSAFNASSVLCLPTQQSRIHSASSNTHPTCFICVSKTRFIGLVCTGVVPPDKRRATRRLTRYMSKCILVLAVHVGAKLAFVSPRDHFHWATAMIAALSSPRCCYRQGDLDMHCVARPHCLTSRFSALFIFSLTPPSPQYISHGTLA